MASILNIIKNVYIKSASNAIPILFPCYLYMYATDRNTLLGATTSFIDQYYENIVKPEDKHNFYDDTNYIKKYSNILAYTNFENYMRVAPDALFSSILTGGIIVPTVVITLPVTLPYLYFFGEDKNIINDSIMNYITSISNNKE